MPVAILTGAGKGMGGACARELVSRGWNVALLSPSGNAETLAKELGGIGITGSVTDPADLARLVDGAMGAWGRIDGAVLSTGHPPKGDLLALSDEDWAKGLDLIILNVVRICRQITPIMEKQGGGAIVNISTFAAFEPDPAFPISCTLRAGLASFAKLYADRYAAQNIRMNNLLPGFIDSLPEKEVFKARIPMKRYGTVAEIAKTAAFLLSPDAGYITGQNIRVDGGITRSV
ncbi:SDR family oxidoreductase [Rhabdaerophilum sp. SD176]|uniref:SDR family oxidoreductase n=1 Tax=Rhabdaerophilum sp. SD176 TaxID=2983548 RepID=UPI0024DF766A|nr:SDR family oxidoreductase [Rhabdaerophilum sp. SD176]